MDRTEIPCEPGSAATDESIGQSAVSLEYENAALLRAIEFCGEHLASPVTVHEIAAAAGLSVRRLQEAFRTHLKATPLGYVRRMRLEAAHADLVKIASGAVSGTVTDVAIRWGFTHLSRFAQHYRMRYGRPPSATLTQSTLGRLPCSADS